MRRGYVSIRRRVSIVVSVLLMVAGLLTINATVGPAPHADAATVTLGTIQGQLSNQSGRDKGTGGTNCITYAPATGTGSSSTSSARVKSPGEAQTGHGTSSNNCPSKLSTSNQSVVGFRPAATTSTPDSTPFLIGQMVHYNNPIYADDEYFSGDLKTVLGGFGGDNTLSFNWTLDETPNVGPGNCCNDLLTFNNQISATTVTQGNLTFRLVVLGFVNAGASNTCPAAPASDPQNVFSTVEGAQTNACLYAALAQVRSLTIVKNVTGSPPGTPSFAYTSTSALTGSPWSNGQFNLGAGGSRKQDLTSGNTVSVTETDPGDDRWSLTGLACQQKNAAGQLVDLPGTTNLAARKVSLTNIPVPLYLTDPSIICTYTNTYTPKSALTLVKQVQGNVANPALWTLTAIGTGATAGTQVSGPSGSAAVTAQRLPAGSYQLSELGTGAAETGFVQVGAWSCTAGGTTYPVNAQAVVALPDLPAGTTVTCRVTNRRAVGSLQITKAIDDPAGGYTGGSTKTFSGSYNCGTGFTGTFATLTTATPVTVTNIPAGRTCTVTENAPTGGLLNASYSWDDPAYTAQPVAITDQGTATVAITNQVQQSFGTFAITKIVNGPGGYTGGPGRVFPTAYSCSLDNGPSSSGTLNVTTAAAVSPAALIPTGSVCTFAESALTIRPGDFGDPSYVWATPAISPVTATIGANATAAITLTNTYARQFGTLIIAKVVQGNGYVGTGQKFTVGYNCGVVSGAVTLAAGGNASVTVPAGNTCTVGEQPPAANLLMSPTPGAARPGRRASARRFRPTDPSP